MIATVTMQVTVRVRVSISDENITPTHQNVMGVLKQRALTEACKPLDALEVDDETSLGVVSVSLPHGAPEVLLQL